MPRGNSQNLKSFADRSTEELREIQRRGGINSGKARRNKTKLKDCLEVLLGQKINIDGKKQTGAEALSVSLFQRALAGDDKAWELLRDTAGQKPIDKVEQQNTEIIVDLSDVNND